jgi:peptidoglycan/xylan/chitin deacetylase (PgdA/CDA1 family)
LLSFDDGYRNHYERVFPLLLAYRMHAMFSLVGSWMDAPEAGAVRYGDEDVPRSRFLSWEQAREMAASGLVEFASHSLRCIRRYPAIHSAADFPRRPLGRSMPTVRPRRQTVDCVRASAPIWNTLSD